ncbi:hypothetical protein PR202_ga17043 [Eleusine coracana subsp. coracana]|uniref:BTB domain-containing protein n=1 Tax=Eleusine coracana subsp. coracana TaxID=191504 RepID=A0AAV5CNF5_ELECO|nr:hypothetical protein PR202_ga17043 [Eleusine coracana subsp. coracana]
MFKSMLHFIYTDTLPKMDDEGDKFTMAKGLVAAAKRYKLDGLKKISEEMLCKSIDLNTVETALLLAEKHHCPTLEAKCMEFPTTETGTLSSANSTRQRAKSTRQTLCRVPALGKVLSVETVPT